MLEPIVLHLNPSFHAGAQHFVLELIAPLPESHHSMPEPYML